MLITALQPIPKKRPVVSISAAGDWVAAINALNPGEIGLLEPGSYTSPSGAITVSGLSSLPITIRGTPYLQSVIDGEGSGTGNGNFAVEFDDCSNLVIEGLLITNYSGIDGVTDYSAGGRADHYEGLKLYQCSNVVIQHCRFYRCSTRGIFVTSADNGNGNIIIGDNIFFENGDDTSSGDINVSTGNGNDNVTVRHNLFCGNVDGYVGGGENVTIEYNLFMFETHENCLDLKGHTLGEAMIRYNVLYGQNCDLGNVTFQQDVSGVVLQGNIISGSNGNNVIKFEGNGTNNDVDDVLVVGNWVTAPVSTDRGIFMTKDAANVIDDITIIHNIFTGADGLLRGIQAFTGEGVTGVLIYNNIFTDLATNSVAQSNNDFVGSNNIYDNNTTWANDSAPIEETPVYATSPIGPLDPTSPGYGEAAEVVGHDYGDNVGIPETFEDLTTLEARIYARLRAIFSAAHISECYTRGGITEPT